MQEENKLKLENYSPLQKQRLGYKTPLPHALANIHNTRIVPLVSENEYGELKHAIKKFFPSTSAQPLVQVEQGRNSNSNSRNLRVGVAFSGRQTPGGHNVICGLYDYIQQLENPEAKLFGFINGNHGLFKGESVEITEDIIEVYRNQGGYDMLGRSVDNIKPEQYKDTLDTCNKLKLDVLVLIGGPRTLTYAAYVAEYLADQQKDSEVQTKVITVPGTIDGDLKSKYLETTFGFDTACKVYSHLIGNIALDGNSARKYYYFIRLMGRAHSHITLECALQTNPNVVLIGEEVVARMKPLDDIVGDICDVICERAKIGKNFGVVLVPEGFVSSVPELHLLIKEMSEILAQPNLPGSDEIEGFVLSKLSAWNTAVFKSLPPSFRDQLLLERESGGSLQLSQIEMEKLLADLVAEELQKRKKAGTYKESFSAICHFFGYQARSALPSNFDCNLAYVNGYAAAVLGSHGLTGVVPSIKNLINPNVEEWEVWGLPISLLMAMPDMTEEIKQRQPKVPSSKVDLRGKPFKLLHKLAKSWQLDDLYSNPGPIQFTGPAANEILATLREEQFASTEQHKRIKELCNKIKTSSLSGCTDEMLTAAVISLEALDKFLAALKKQ